MQFKYSFLWVVLGLLTFTACEKMEVDQLALTDFPPGLLEISPADNGKVVIGDFNVKVVFVDGTTSPLASAEVALMDANSTELAAATKSLTGVRDSIVIEGSTFDAANLPVGTYSLSIKVTDSRGQLREQNTTFEISLLPFPANYDEMYIAGAFNGWGADPMTLVAPNTWEIKEIDLMGGAFKLKNCADWCDQDWGGDASCNGIMENTTGGGPDNTCAGNGLVNLRFNDQTLRYTIEPAVLFAKNVAELYLLGTFNTFQGADYQFSLVDDNTWTLNEVLLENGTQFKFAEMPDFNGKNYGDAEGDGIAELYGPNINFTEQDAFYDVVFNDKTLAYTITFVRFPSIGIIGSATPGGWDTDTDMTDNGDGTFSINIELIDGEAKFRANDSWDTNWGATDFPTGIGTLGGDNIPVPAGKYDVTFNPETGAYSFELDEGYESIGVIGSATPGGWDSDTDMTLNEDGTYSLIIALEDGEVKFRADDDWEVSWGSGDFPTGIGAIPGSNIPVTAGVYNVTFNAETGAYSFTEASIGIIGSATPGGWDTDTDMTFEGGGVVSVTMDLIEGEAKFRANDAWDVSWGAVDFPTGTGTVNGPNIPVPAGNYTIKFNVNTGAYSFE